ncbi:hypothetical protein LENED_009705 [Lentinula edodes]|uniref:Uncharacterized protein n=1 Tax=Lentinula edodes TaxID=5353 RepID=A0A1Q3EKI7_LENED|nr:hypothetical protein LENED_009705 [Lentinula edodes]
MEGSVSDCVRDEKPGRVTGPSQVLRVCLGGRVRFDFLVRTVRWSCKYHSSYGLGRLIDCDCDGPAGGAAKIEGPAATDKSPPFMLDLYEIEQESPKYTHDVVLCEVWLPCH